MFKTEKTFTVAPTGQVSISEKIQQTGKHERKTIPKKSQFTQQQSSDNTNNYKKVIRRNTLGATTVAALTTKPLKDLLVKAPGFNVPKEENFTADSLSPCNEAKFLADAVTDDAVS